MKSARLLLASLSLLPILLVGSGPPAAAQSGGQNGKSGSALCADCHREQFTRFAATRMGELFLNHPRNSLERRGCEACHGPGRAHAESGGESKADLITFGRNSPTPVGERNQVCLQCHESTARLFWKGSPHEGRDVGCTDCHQMMSALTERGHLKKATVVETCAQCHLQRKSQQLRSSHMPLREGKMECTSCHNPHGSPGEKLLVASSVNEVCYNCHAEKRGPFLWEHAPVVESCANCHDPHGSNKEKMLKVAKPRLCQQCHIESRHPTNPQLPGTNFTMNRQCVNCHAQIHGSNHPSGNRFLR
ncbi:MAG: DmsE family decaheme c-type cytochrome [Gemmatimonadetes bacterium]|nr:DmsE family decaheme c-type cytochrome [Gemmatimonadota bacterium]